MDDNIVWHGADDLADSLTPVDTLAPLPGNPRQGDVGAISQSLERFGQLKPIVVDGAGVIIAGNHTYKAAAALGWTHIATTSPDHLDGADLSAFALADNRLSDLADYDHEALLSILKDVSQAEGGLEGTGYDLDDLEDLHQLVSGPLDLQGLTDKYGENDDINQFWPTITLKVPPAVKALWDEHVDDSYKRLEEILTRVKS